MLGVTPFSYRFQREQVVHAFTFERAAYRSTTQEVTVTSDGAVAVALTPEPKRVARKPVVAPQPVQAHVDLNSTMKVFE